MLGRPRIPHNSIFGELVLLSTICASFVLVIPRIAIAGRLWLESKTAKIFVGRLDAPHIVLIIDDDTGHHKRSVKFVYVMLMWCI